MRQLRRPGPRLAAITATEACSSSPTRHPLLAQRRRTVDRRRGILQLIGEGEELRGRADNGVGVRGCMIEPQPIGVAAQVERQLSQLGGGEPQQTLAGRLGSGQAFPAWRGADGVKSSRLAASTCARANEATPLDAAAPIRV